jgi:outer membrane lipoprotein-sorting protein
MCKRRKTLISFSALLFVTSCAQSQKVVTETPTSDTVVSSIPPFQTKEPERYRATRTITTVTAGGETTVTKNFLARNGELRRDESETGMQKIVYLNLPEGRFVLLPDEKLFADVTAVDQAAGVEEDSENSPDRLLHTEPITTSYQQLGVEITGGRSAQKYRVVVNGSPQTNVSVTETTIWIDETLHMPIRSETVSRDGTRVTMELSDIALDVDGSIFQIPNGYGKIAFNELRTRLKKVESKP